jgi:AraC family transcriptional regulator of adaptative response / DNA-3-methyladenine glycosylase II
MLHADACFAAMQARDARFDGVFFTGVISTGIYCRPVCPARTPLRKNCEFFSSAAAAERRGLRPCLRCRPELAPGRAPMDHVSRLARRAYRMIQAGHLDEVSVPALATQLGVSDRHLRRVLESEFGVGPLEIAHTRRLLLAKRLLTDTALPVGEIAFASGFGSLRRFNDAFAASYRMAPRDLRRRSVVAETISVDLFYEPPYAWEPMFRYFQLRTLAGIDEAENGVFRRTISYRGDSGTIAVTPVPDETMVRVSVSTSLAQHLPWILRRVRRQFDLDVDMPLVSGTLGEVAKIEGLRLPAAFDPFECAIRTIIGQQVSVAGATTVTNRLIQNLGESTSVDPTLDRTFPSPTRLANASVGEIASLGMPGKRAETIIQFSAFAERGGLSGATPNVEDLVQLPGIGPWTAEYIRMRGFGWPDAFPAADLGLMKALGTQSAREAETRAESWRPWRSYAAMQLWNQP